MPVCKKCGDQFPVKPLIDGTRRNFQNRKYCLSCSPFGQHNTAKLHKIRAQRSKPRKVLGTNSCRQCGKTPVRNTYCSNACQQEWLLAQRITKVRELGRINLPCNARTAKRIVLALRERECAVCGLTEWQGKEISLVLDHINGNATDWLFTNLRLICPNCAAQTVTFKGRNRGNGRHARRERYRQGKSY